MVADIEVDMVPAWRWTRWPTWWPKKKKEKRRKVVDMELDMVADMELDMVADIKVDKVADMEVDIDINININKEIRFGERVGHKGWLNGPKLFRLEAYHPTCASSMLCKLISFAVLTESVFQLTRKLI